MFLITVSESFSIHFHSASNYKIISPSTAPFNPAAFASSVSICTAKPALALYTCNYVPKIKERSLSPTLEKQFVGLLYPIVLLHQVEYVHDVLPQSHLLVSSTSPFGPINLHPGVPSNWPDSRIGASIPTFLASVRDNSTWVSDVLVLK